MKKIFGLLILATVLWTIAALCRAENVSSSQAVPVESSTISVSGGGGGGGGGSGDIGNEVFPVDRLPVESVAALRSYAIEEIRRGYISVYSPTLVWPGAKTYGEFRYAPSEDGVNLAEVRSLFWQQKLTFALANPRSQVQVYAQLSNNEGDQLFQGWNFFQLEKRGERWQVPEKGILFELQLVDRIPIHVPESVGYGRIQEWNEDGEVTAEVNVDVRNGKLYFPTYFAGRNGRLYLNVRGDDQSERAVLFDLRTGRPAEVSDVSANFLPLLQNVIDVDGPSVIRWSVTEERASTLFILSFRAKQSITVFPLQGTDGSGSVVARAVTVWIRKIGGSGFSDGIKWDRSVFDGDKPIEGTLGPGRYHLFFEWPDGFGRGFEGGPPPQSGGKG